MSRSKVTHSFIVHEAFVASFAAHLAIIQPPPQGVMNPIMENLIHPYLLQVSQFTSVPTPPNRPPIMLSVS